MPTRENPTIDAAALDAARDTFVTALRRELTVLGADTPEVETLLRAELHARLKTTPIMLADGSELARVDVRFIGFATGAALSATAAARDIADQARRAKALAAHGADPKGVLIARLVALGVPDHEAQGYAPRISRELDGRVSWMANGQRVATHGSTEPELQRAVESLTRAILAERERAAMRNDRTRQDRHRTIASSAF